METIQQTFITEEQIAPPLEEILGKTTLSYSEQYLLKRIPKTITQSLDELFPEQQREEKNIQKAKDTLGALADQFTQEQLKDMVTEIQYLVDSWLDDFERKTFTGQALNELLNEGRRMNLTGNTIYEAGKRAMIYLRVSTEEQ